MFIDFLLEVFGQHRNSEAIIWRDRSYSYDWILSRYKEIESLLHQHKVVAGEVVAIQADFSPTTVAVMLLLVQRGCIVVPLTSYVPERIAPLLQLGEVERVVCVSETDEVSITVTGTRATHPLYQELAKTRKHPGLVLFSSGSTGQAKGAVHDFDMLLQKFRTKRQNLRTMTFLLLDHIGGIDTLLYSLSNGSCVITVQDRSPASVCSAIEKHRVEVLPVTPTFLNLMILSGVYAEHDLSSLKYITYGTEVMPEATLKRCAELFPNVKLLQKYGTTETGTLRSKSKSSDSVWVKVGGEGFQTRIVNGMLEIKAHSAMMGYLNAPSPFTEDGWFMTGDVVDQDGEYIRFRGRQSDVINVGGEKVFPAEVESVIMEVENVSEALVYSEKNALVGNIVCANVQLKNPEALDEAIKRIRRHCKSKLESFKVPVKIAIVEDLRHSERFKKVRKLES